MNYWYLIIPAAILLLMLILLLLLHYKKKSVIQKVNSLSAPEKNELLNHLAEPVGYLYDSCQDIFTARMDTPQKLFGCNTFYTSTAASFNIVYDYETIYFDYNGRTWLIEMRKGQYGIHAGCELGVYYADTIVPPEEYSTTHFQAVESWDMPDISIGLNCHCPTISHQQSKLGYRRQRNCWLTLFKMGTFARPEELSVNISIHFKDYGMLCAFLDSFDETLPDTIYKINGHTVYFTFRQSNRKYSFPRRLLRSISLQSCKLYCKWFNHMTGDFTNSGNKLLYLYYYLPFVIRPLCSLKKAKK